MNSRSLPQLSAKVKAALREAHNTSLLTYRQKAAWLREKASALSRDDVLWLVRKLNWPFSAASIDTLTRRRGALTKAFDAGGIDFKWLHTISLRQYFEQIAGVRFNRANKAKCPFHAGRTQTTLVVDEARGKWTCFGECDRSGDLLDAHELLYEFASRGAAYDDLRKRCRSLLNQTDTPPPLPARREPRAAERNLELVAEVLRQTPRAGFRQSEATARDFAAVWLSLLEPDDLPIVFYDLYTPIIGQRARRILSSQPEGLQYLCCCTARSVRGGNRNSNLAERMFLDVEFDHEPAQRQLRLLWYLGQQENWKLVSITHSGHNSYHGLFYVRDLTEQQIDEMRQLALRLGACAGSLRKHQPVRFPGGVRRDGNRLTRQAIIVLVRKLW